MFKNVTAVIITVIICLMIVIFIAVPHHSVTKAEAVDMACEYFLYRMNNTMEIESANLRGYESNMPENILDYWNRDIGHYTVSISVVGGSVPFDICVDTFTGYVYDGSEGIMWKK